MTLSPESVLQGLTAPQREAATTIDGPLLVLAGAGSGKTRTITRRIAYMVACGIPAWNILAITFTNKAAGEMRERVNALLGGEGRRARGVTVATFHALCARILREYAEAAGLDRNFTIFDTADQAKLVKQAVKDCALNVDNFQPSAVLSAISSAKNKLQTPQVFAANAAAFFEKNVARVYVRYEGLLRENKGVDFDDLLLKTALLLRDNKDVRTKLEERYQYILIDEYQDTNHAQFLIAHMLAMHHKNICATGDPDQSIYGWRGANLNNILEFEQFYPNAKTVLLEQNYRSTKIILQAASALIAHNTKRKKKDLWTENETGPKITVLETNDEHEEAAEVVRRLRESHDREGLKWDQFAIFYRVNSLSRVLEDALMKSGIPYQIARGTEFYARKEIKDIIAYLKVVSNAGDNVSFERIINVPPRGLGDTSLTKLSTFAAQREITLMDACAVADRAEGMTPRAANACRKLAELFGQWRTLVAPSASSPAEPAGEDPLFDVSLAQAINDSEEYVPDIEEAEGASGEAGVSDSTEGKPSFLIPGGVRGLVERVYKESGLEAELRKKEDDPDHEKAANIEELINVAAEFDRSHTRGSLNDFLEQVTLASDVDKIKDAGGAVTLMTLHAAKGLEFPWVAMVGMEDGLIPHARAIGFTSGPDEMEEERRLAFVGITRAMKKLTLSHARYRMVRGETLRTVASQFLKEIPGECLEEIDLTGGGDEEPGSLGYRDEGSYARRAQQQRQRESVEQRAEAQDMTGEFRRGILVRHPQFGLGRIEEITSAGTMTRAVVQFQGAGRKTLILQYARLERVDT